MAIARVEHANITVRDPLGTANLLVDLFGWHIRWQGVGIYEGYTVHVGGEDSYLALYKRDSKDVSLDLPTLEPDNSSYNHPTGLNHIGIVVDGLEHTESRIKRAGFKTHSHADYEPGKRFYFHDNDGLEFEVVSYTG